MRKFFKHIIAAGFAVVMALGTIATPAMAAYEYEEEDLIQDIKVTRISISATSLSMPIGYVRTVGLSGYSPAKAVITAVRYTSSAPEIASVDASGRITARKPGNATITVSAYTGKERATATCRVLVYKPNMLYRVHGQTYGWQSWVLNNATAGTTGMSKRLEAIQIITHGAGNPGGVQYQAHVQSIGWQGWKQNGQLAGTTGLGKRMEAIRIKLTNDAAKYCDIYYRMHIQHYGWTGWAKNGGTCGSIGLGLRAEAIQICEVTKGTKFPTNAMPAYYYKK